MSYASLDDLKESLRITDDSDDALLQVALDAATELITEHCNRTFTASEMATQRWFIPRNGVVIVDDIYSEVGLLVDVAGILIPEAVENVSAGYVLKPDNAPALGEPYTSIEYSFPTAAAWPLTFAISRHRVAITAKWGYAAEVPESVRQACILQASRIFSRRHAPFGVAGSPEIGSEIRLLSKVDPDVAVLLSGKVRYR